MDLHPTQGLGETGQPDCQESPKTNGSLNLSANSAWLKLPLTKSVSGGHSHAQADASVVLKSVLKLIRCAVAPQFQPNKQASRINGRGAVACGKVVMGRQLADLIVFNVSDVDTCWLNFCYSYSCNSVVSTQFSS